MHRSKNRRWSLLPLLLAASVAVGAEQNPTATPTLAEVKAQNSRERQHMIERVDAMGKGLNTLEQAMHAGSTSAQEQQIADLRRQVAELRKELESVPRYLEQTRSGGATP